MHIKRWVRPALLAGVWAYATAIWASMFHHLLGLPDVTLVATVAAAILAATWALRPAGPRPSTEGRAPQTRGPESARF